MNQLKNVLNDFSEKKCVSKGKLIQPLRVSLCGSLTGPSMARLDDGFRQRKHVSEG